MTPVGRSKHARTSVSFERLDDVLLNPRVAKVPPPRTIRLTLPLTTAAAAPARLVGIGGNECHAVCPPRRPSEVAVSPAAVHPPAITVPEASKPPTTCTLPRLNDGPAVTPTALTISANPSSPRRRGDPRAAAHRAAVHADARLHEPPFRFGKSEQRGDRELRSREGPCGRRRQTTRPSPHARQLAKSTSGSAHSPSASNCRATPSYRHSLAPGFPRRTRSLQRGTGWLDSSRGRARSVVDVSRLAIVHLRASDLQMRFNANLRVK